MLGKMQPHHADYFIDNHPEASLGSMSADGMRRVIGPESLLDAFAEAGGIVYNSTGTTPNECLPCKPGDAIKEKLIQETGDTTVCDECQKEIERLNTMTPEEVLAEAPELAERITERAKTKAKSLLHRTAATLAPGMVADKVEGWIEDAINQ